MVGSQEFLTWIQDRLLVKQAAVMFPAELEQIKAVQIAAGNSEGFRLLVLRLATELDQADPGSVSTDEQNYAVKAAYEAGKQAALKEALQWVELRLSQDPNPESPPEV